MKDSLIQVVIVDDHQMIRETWRMLLESDKEISVIGVCVSGEEAISTAAQLQPDVMLMDINMAPINGFDATREIVKNNPGIKIIGISINNQPTYVRNLMQLGARGYVTKNSPRDEMIKAIKEVYIGNTYICKDVNPVMDEGSLPN